MKDEMLMISFSLKRRRVLIHRSTIRALNMPQNIRFLLNTAKNRVVIQSCEPIDRDNFAVPDFNSVCQFEISSINFLNVVYKMAKWDSEKTYRVEGKHYEANHLVEFDLRRSVQISDDEFVDEDAIIPDSIKQEMGEI